MSKSLENTQDSEAKEIVDEIIEKETKKAEEKAEVENQVANHNFIISQNRVLFVDKITNKEIKSGGKFAQGQNYMTGESVQILDKDYGKSAELMRALLETENATPLWKKALILLILGGIILGVGIALFSIFPSGEKVENKPIIENSGTQQVTEENSIVKGTLTPPKIEIEEPEIEEPLNGQPIKSFNPNENIEVIQVNSEIQNLKHTYEIESLKIEYQRLMEEKNIEVQKNFELKTELEEKNTLISELKQKVKIYEEKPQNLNEDAFLLHLGNVVYKKCEKAIAKGEENACKEIYYNFLKQKENDT